MPPFLTYLRRCAGMLTSGEGCSIDVWEMGAPLPPEVIRIWASHFRNHYCPDSEIDVLRNGTGLTRAEFLTQLIFPDEHTAPGPSIRAGDFAEVLISDYVEHVLGYWVPREKFAEKSVRDESVKGVDILGFRSTVARPSPRDELIAFEVKAELSGRAYSQGLQRAVTDSAKDYLRSAFTLNATKRRLLRANETERAMVVERFQNRADRPFLFKSGAAAILSDISYDETGICAVSTAQHTNQADLQLLVVRGTALMPLVRALFQIAADEA